MDRYEKEWAKLSKKEQAFLKGRAEAKGSFLTNALEDKIPEKLQSTLNAAFKKAFGFVFEKGAGIIEKTYDRDKLEKNYRVNQAVDEIYGTRKSLKSFSKAAGKTGAGNTLIAGAAGVGMGVFGVGIPDIPVFTAMLLRNINEIALHYGFEYNSKKERYFILLLIRGALICGREALETDRCINDYIETEHLPEGYLEENQINKTAEVLSRELLYAKFLQGIPIAGAVGGIQDAVYMKRISEYADLKYRRRFLQKKKGQEKT